MRYVRSGVVSRCVASHRSFASTSARNAISASDAKPGLLLLIGSDVLPRSLLIPSDVQPLRVEPNPHKIVDSVVRHYSKLDAVFGKGETDRGIWFAGGTQDALHHAELIHDSMEGIKEHRHTITDHRRGIPFGIYSDGLMRSPHINWRAVASCKLQISLFADNPKEYAKVSGGSEKDFAHILAVIMTAADYTTVGMGLLEDHASNADSLAESLGAKEIVLYNKDDYRTAD